MSCCGCKVGDAPGLRGSILYTILNGGSARPETPVAHRRCSCVSKRPPVAIRTPLFKAASDVLVKTFKFVKNVPCFRGLPAGDQLRLVRKSWAPLLVLGLVQDRVDLRAVETRRPSLLHWILTRAATEIQEPGGAVSDAAGIQMFLVRCRGLRISVKEYAFMKGAILFTPVMELECRDYIEALCREAEFALYDHVRTVHRGNAGRFARLRAVLDALRSVDPDSVARLFLGPVSGTASVDEHVLAMFYEQSPK